MFQELFEKMPRKMFRVVRLKGYGIKITFHVTMTGKGLSDLTAGDYGLSWELRLDKDDARAFAAWLRGDRVLDFTTASLSVHMYDSGPLLQQTSAQGVMTVGLGSPDDVNALLNKIEVALEVFADQRFEGDLMKFDPDYEADWD